MKNTIVVIALLVTTITIAQNNLFSNISTTDHYQEYKSVIDADGDGVYDIADRGSVVKFKLKHLQTGEGYAISAIADQGRNKGDYINGGNAVDANYQCVGYPFESYIKDKSSNNALVAIGDYVFYIKNISQDGTSYNAVSRVYIKIGAASNKPQKKPEISSMQMVKMFTSRGSDKVAKPEIDFGTEHKALQSQNLDKMITDYLVTMKTKQNGRTATQKQSDSRIIKAKEEAVIAKKEAAKEAKAARDAEWAEAQKHNDSVKGTAKWQEQNRRIKQNEANYLGAQKASVVTLRNNSGSSIYVGKSGSVNRGIEIPAGGTGGWDCDYDAYIQKHTIKGGSNAYRSTNTKVYSKNSGCGDTVNIN
ncbi:hypothetical protein SCB49_05515 [unidentified eubacterium SCB49]|nr:hypothetical protein SCB49_05515 [unidentified eubacterium SCB49]